MKSKGMRCVRWSACAAAAFLLVACGGGGGGGGGGAALSSVSIPASTAPGSGGGAAEGTPTGAGGAATGATGTAGGNGTAGAGNSAGGSSGGAAGGSTGGAAGGAGSGPFSFKVTELATGLVSPWSLAFLPDGRMLVTHRQGQLRIRNADGSSFNGGADAISGVPAVDSGGQGGLLDVVLDPGFATNRRIYLSFAERDGNDPSLNGTAVARAELDLASRSLVNLVVIYRQLPKVASSGHYGSRLVFDRNGFLFVTTGERQIDSQQGFAQDLTRGNGKVVRITTDGAPAPGNPFISGPNGAQPHIWSYGHRNPQGAALNPVTGELWTNEHGPRGGDEVNLTLPGRNYGWPLVSYGQQYNTTDPIGPTTAPGVEPPLTHWENIDGRDGQPGVPNQSIAPSGMAFYTADALPAWKGNVFVGALAGGALWRLTVNGNTVTARERLLYDRGERIRDVRQGPDGNLYLLTDSTSAKLLRIERAN